MTWRGVTISGYLLVLVAGALLELASRRRGSRTPHFPEVITGAMATRAGRVAAVAAWAWVGLHFFAR